MFGEVSGIRTSIHAENPVDGSPANLISGPFAKQVLTTLFYASLTAVVCAFIGVLTPYKQMGIPFGTWYLAVANQLGLQYTANYMVNMYKTLKQQPVTGLQLLYVREVVTHFI